MANLYCNDFETHRPALLSAIKFLRERRKFLNVVEVGTGWGSTPFLLSNLTHPSDRLFSFENDLSWHQEMSRHFPGSESHEWIFVGSSWYHSLREFSRLTRPIDILFIDSSPWESRTMALDLLSKRSALTLIHDVDYYPHNRIWGVERSEILRPSEVGFRDYSSVFPFWVEVFPTEFFAETGPPTVIGSFDHPEIVDLEFEESFVAGRSAGDGNLL